MPHNALNVRITTFPALVLSIPDFNAAKPSSTAVQACQSIGFILPIPISMDVLSVGGIETFCVSFDSVLHSKMVRMAS